MNGKLSGFHKMLLADFIGNFWAAFEQYCAAHGEGIADEIYEALNDNEGTES